MTSLIRNLSGRKHWKSNSVFPALLIMVAVCYSLVGCGQPTSNNLPKRSDSTAAGSAAAVDSASPGQQPAGNAGPLASTDTGKLGGTWFLVAVLPSDTAAGKVPTINFDENSKKFSGNTGCNNMRGSFSATDSTLKIDEQIITTKMACPGYNEQAFLKNLPKANGYRFENGMLVLLSDQTELSRWTRQPVKPTIKTT